jgi:hypothetical protein
MVHYECICIGLFMVACNYVRMCLVSFGYVTLVLQLARGSGSIMGSLFKVLFSRGSDPYMRSLFSKCTSRVVVVRTCGRISKCYSRVVVIRTCVSFRIGCVCFC